MTWYAEPRSLQCEWFGDSSEPEIQHGGREWKRVDIQLLRRFESHLEAALPDPKVNVDRLGQQITFYYELRELLYVTGFTDPDSPYIFSGRDGQRERGAAAPSHH